MKQGRFPMPLVSRPRPDAETGRAAHVRLPGWAMCGTLLLCGCVQSIPVTSPATIWRANDSRTLAGKTAEVLGAPTEKAEGGRRSVVFDGRRDGFVFPINPIAGQRAFTIEVLFNPDGSGAPAQRFVHVEDAHQNRALIETRITPERQWYLDTFLYAHPREPGLTLVDRNRLHPCDQWYWAALVYDGATMRHFVNGVKELEGRIDYGPMTEGRTSIGVRLNQVFWFKGAIAEVRFHREALAPPALQSVR